MALIPLSEIQAARERIRPYVISTLTLEQRAVSEQLGRRAFLKLELLQRCGMFKVRGAFNKLLTLSQAERQAGVVAVSGGNHAIAVAYAARTLGIQAVVIMPQTTPSNYVQAAKADGAEVRLTPTVHDAFAEAERMQATGLTFVHPFDDPLVIAGQGTLALEMLEAAPELSDIVVSIGGGGLMSGVASAVKALRPEIRIWGVETEGADAMTQALEAGQPVQLPAITSIAKTLGAPSVTARTLSVAQAHLEQVLRVSDAQALSDLLFLLEQAKVLCEPAASCTLSASRILASRLPSDATVGLILCGGNTTLEQIEQWKSQLGV